MSTKKNATPLREQIIAFLSGQEEATLKQIASATTERDFPSRVTTELNRLRTDAVVECAKKKGKNELWYWINSQPAVEQNTGSSGAGANATQPAGAAVQHNPAPVPAASLSAEPAAVDEPAQTRKAKTAARAKQAAPARAVKPTKPKAQAAGAARKPKEKAKTGGRVAAAGGKGSPADELPQYRCPNTMDMLEGAV